MNQPTPSDFTPEMVSDPATNSATLAQAAAVRPDLWPAVLQHPNVDAATAEWIRSSQASAAEAAVAQSAARAQKEKDPSIQQISSGAKQIAGGAKELYASRIAPAVTRAGSTAKRTLTDKTERKSFFGEASRWPLFVSLGGALLGLIALMLPVTTVRSFYVEETFGFFDETKLKTEATFLLVLFLLVVLTSVAVFFVKKPVLSVIAAVLTVIAGGFSAFDSFGNIGRLQDAATKVQGLGTVEIGSGLWLLAAASVALLLGGAWHALRLNQARAAGQAPAAGHTPAETEPGAA